MSYQAEDQNDIGYKVDFPLLHFKEIHGFEQQYRYSYDTAISTESLNRLAQSTDYGQTVNASSLSSVASSIMHTRLDLDAGNQAIQLPIANGWDTKRYRFKLVVGMNSRHGGGIRVVLNGYTDQMGIASTGQPDPNMRMYINSVVTLRDSVVNNQTISSVVSNDAFLAAVRDEVGHLNAQIQNVDYSLRPTDIYSNSAAAATINNWAGEILSRQGGPVHNLKTGMNSGAKLSAKTNNSPAHYATKMINAASRVNSDMELEDVPEVDQSNMMRRHAQEVAETQLANNQFLTMLESVVEVNQQGYFTYRDLCQLDRKGQLNHTTKVENMGHGHVVQMYGTISESWNTATMTTAVAAQLVATLPSIINMSNLKVVAFDWTNMTIGNQGPLFTPRPELIGTDVPGIDAADAFMRHFTRLFALHVQPAITRNNEIGVALSIFCEDESKIEFSLQIENEEPVEYSAPLCADSILSPLITRNQKTLDNIYRDYANITDHLRSGGESYYGRGNVYHGDMNQPAPNHMGGYYADAHQFNEPAPAPAPQQDSSSHRRGW